MDFRTCHKCGKPNSIEAFPIDHKSNAKIKHSNICNSCLQLAFEKWKTGIVKMDKSIKARTVCPRCKARGSSTLAIKVFSNGVKHVFGFCLACLRDYGTPIPKKKAQKLVDVSALPIMDVYEGEKCAVNDCVKTDTELHHMMPRYIARKAWGEQHGNYEADRWPMVYLCNQHHVMWHDLLTPERMKSEAGQTDETIKKAMVKNEQAES